MAPPSNEARVSERRPHGGRRAILALLILLGWLAGALGADGGSGPRVALIIDDMGNQRGYGRQALALPGAVTYSFLPFTPYGAELAGEAHRLHKEVMLHLPMESVSGGGLGPGELHVAMSRAQFRSELWQAIGSLPYVAGLNNHEGSLLTSDPVAMTWLMDELRDAALFFVDSRTTKETVAERIAEESGVPSTRRNVFLDNEREPEAIRRQLGKLLHLAADQGSAVGIGHPYPETISVLAQELPYLEDWGFLLVPVSQLTQTDGRNKPWHVSSSPLPRVAKSSKP